MNNPLNKFLFLFLFLIIIVAMKAIVDRHTTNTELCKTMDGECSYRVSKNLCYCDGKYKDPYDFSMHYDELDEIIEQMLDDQELYTHDLG